MHKRKRHGSTYTYTHIHREKVTKKDPLDHVYYFVPLLYSFFTSTSSYAKPKSMVYLPKEKIRYSFVDIYYLYFYYMVFFFWENNRDTHTHTQWPAIYDDELFFPLNLKVMWTKVPVHKNPN